MLFTNAAVFPFCVQTSTILRTALILIMCKNKSIMDNPVSSENVQWQRWSTWNDVTISQSGLSKCEMVTFCQPIVLHWRVLTSRDSQAPVCGEENMADIPCFLR